MLEKINSDTNPLFKVKRHSDDMVFAMKKIADVNQEELSQVVNEASLITSLNSDELIKCEDLYYF